MVIGEAERSLHIYMEQKWHCFVCSWIRECTLWWLMHLRGFLMPMIPYLVSVGEAGIYPLASNKEAWLLFKGRENHMSCEAVPKFRNLQ